MQNTNDNLEKIQRFILRNRGRIKNLEQVQNQRELNPNQILGIDVLNEIENINNDGDIYFGFQQITQIRKLYNEKIRNLVLTKQGEKLFDINYGSDIYNFLFTQELKEQNTEIARQYIFSLIQNNFSELLNIEVNIVREEDGSSFVYLIYLDYEIPFIGNNTDIIEILQ